jgi:cephalosporin hydroxylase
MPFDLWVMQEIIYETKPDMIVETGTACGGSALFFASVFNGKVITIDTQQYDDMKPKFKHPRIKFLKGKSTDVRVVNKVKKEIEGKRVMVLLDSDHAMKNVMAEMEIYGEMVSKDCYMIVHDTNLGGNPVFQNVDTDGPGPMQAVLSYIGRHPEFKIDNDREKFFFTFSPNGWLKRVS